MEIFYTHWFLAISLLSFTTMIHAQAKIQRAPQSEGNLIGVADKYILSVESTPSFAEIGKSTKLVFSLKTKDGKKTDVVLMHEKLMHLIVVSKDLSWFSHIHPEQTKDGGFEISLIFPFGGTFKLFSELTPKWDSPQRFQIEINVKGLVKKSQPFISSLNQKKDGFTYELVIEPKAVANSDVMLMFDAKQGKGAFQIEPYLGARGHCVIISEDGKDYLHAHPMEDEPSSNKLAQGQKDPSGKIMFHTHFPKSGKYRVWIQFQVAGKVNTADFVVDVK